MITYTQGNIFDSKCDVLVNPCNCVGVMGKGLALDFKKKFPNNFAFYKSMCDVGQMEIGSVLWYLDEDNHKIIANFPTKVHWRNPSVLEWIEAGLSDLLKGCYLYDIESIAIPRLGCGNGRLKWKDVSTLIEKYFEPTPIDAEVYI